MSHSHSHLTCPRKTERENPLFRRFSPLQHAILPQAFAGSAAQARLSDQRTIQKIGVPSLVLMENAAFSMSACLLEKNHERYAILCGPGNNGADGLAMARILTQYKKEVCIFIDPARCSQDEAIQLQICRQLGLSILSLDEAKNLMQPSSCRFDAIIDGLFGSGLSRPVSGVFADVIEAANQSGLPIYSIDIASGIDGTTGQKLGHAIQAEQTLCLDLVKTGQLLQDGPSHSGAVALMDIGIPSFVHQDVKAWPIISKQQAASCLPKRPQESHKGTFGKVLLAGGSLQMQGALAMAAASCFASGCGTLSLFAPSNAAQALRCKMDCAMVLDGAQDDEGFFAGEAKEQLVQILPKYTLAGCGSGMSARPACAAITQALLASDLPLVLDADAINTLAGKESLLDRHAPLVLTPHLKEFSRLASIPFDEVQKDPFGCALTFASRHPDTVLVLKSNFTLIVQGERKAMVLRPDAALAKGGSGDTLFGLVCSLMAQSRQPFESAVLAVWIHNQAARFAASPYTCTPDFLVSQYGTIFADLETIRTAA